MPLSRIDAQSDNAYSQAQRPASDPILWITIESGMYYSLEGGSTTMTALGANHSYILAEVLRHGAKRALDFGCGSGALVAEGLKQGIAFSGTDTFSDTQWENRDAAARTGLMGLHVHRIADDRQPFDDDTFDFVSANMVFEHLPEIDPCLAEIRRVLKPGGVFLNLFPTVGVLREGHCGVPLAHRFNRWPWLQTAYLRAWRNAGFGYEKGDRRPDEWARFFSAYLRGETSYRPWRQIKAAYRRNGFTDISTHEDDYAAFRLRGRFPAAASAATAPAVRGLTKMAVRRLATMVVEAR